MNPGKRQSGNSGFTIIELLVVIAIIGILAVVAIPKFFDIRESAHYEVKTRVIGVIKSGLANYGNNETSVNQERSYPATAALTLEMIMDEIPDKWTYNPGTGAITYSGDNSTWLYTSPVGGDASLYTLILQ